MHLTTDNVNVSIFKDFRLDERFKKISKQLLDKPGSIIFSSFDKNCEKKAAYKFFSNDKVSTERIFKNEFENTINKMQECSDDILLIQDTSYLMIKSKLAFKDSTEYIGSFKSENKSKKNNLMYGIALHSAIAVTANGIPLGLFDASIYEHEQKSTCRTRLPIEEKESERWLLPIEKAKKCFCEKTNIIIVCDREGDIHEVLSFGFQMDSKFIIRMQQDRNVKIKKGTNNKGNNTDKSLKVSKVFEISNNEFEYNTTIYCGESSKFVERSFVVKYEKIIIPKAKNKVYSKWTSLNKEIEVTAVSIYSKDTLKEINWTLLTNLEINNFADAIKVISYYKNRWHIENYHKTLKSVFNVEDIRLETKDALKNLIATLAIASTKIYYMIHYSRVNPDDSCEAFLKSEEWKTLCLVSRKNKNAEKPPTAKEAITMIAMLGGYMNRKNDLNPGIIVISRGWKRLKDMALIYESLAN